MAAASCAICQSPMRTEIEGVDSQLRPDKVIEWARQKGMKLTRQSLARHRAKHRSTVIGSAAEDVSNTAKPSGNETPIESPSRADELNAATVSDQQFLDTVRDMAFRQLLAGEMDLKLDAAFKAIEIKYKIAAESQNERLLLEILNEIRSEELRKTITG